MKYRNRLPQTHGKDVSAMGGVETWLQYGEGFPLRHFCAFEWLRDPKAKAALRDFHRKEIEAVVPHGFGMIVEGIHYRASADWGDLCGYTRADLADINAEGIELYLELAREFDSPDTPMIVAGNIGPRGDAYDKGGAISADQAEEYHSAQIATLKDAGADMITGATLGLAEEAIGIARAGKALGMPVALSFFVTGEGRLSSDQSIGQAIQAVDAATDGSPAYYLINCAHPLEFEQSLEDRPWMRRLCGLMPNASAKDKISLCRLGHLEDGDPEELGQQMAGIAGKFPHIHVWGGCCGTDARHLGQIARQVSAQRRQMQPA